MRSAILACVLFSATASAQEAPSIAVVAQDAELASSLVTALSPWNVDVRAIEASAPGASMPGSSERGRAIAESEGADAVVWLSESEDGWAVWVYDRAEDRAMARRLASGPPFDAPTAAAIALSIVTLLRDSAVAPPSERRRPPEPPPAPPVLLAPSPSYREGRIEVAIGAEGWATDPDAVEARIALAASFWPRELSESLGFGLAVRSGMGVGVTHEALSARLLEVRALARVHARARIAGPLSLGGLLGLGVRVTVLEGSLDGQRAEVVRAAGVLELQGELGVEAGPISFALRAGAAATPWLHAYEIDGAPVLATQPVWPLVDVALEVAF
jgi:hypothetical protein